MRKTRDAIFFAKALPSGFYALFVNGNPEFLNAALKSVDAVRKEVDAIARAAKLTCYTLTFHQEEYNYILSQKGA